MKDNLKNALQELTLGHFVLVCDDKDREDEADLIMAAQFVDSSSINFMINQGRGLICVPLSATRAEYLGLDLMVPANKGTLEVAFTISVDAKIGTHTGISSRDRATTIKMLSNEFASKNDFVAPGHIFPLIAHPGGLKTRPGHTEASVELMRLGGLTEVAVLCETLDSEGEPLKGAPLETFAKKWNIPIISIKEILEAL